VRGQWLYVISLCAIGRQWPSPTIAQVTLMLLLRRVVPAWLHAAKKDIGGVMRQAEAARVSCIGRTRSGCKDSEQSASASGFLRTNNSLSAGTLPNRQQHSVGRRGPTESYMLSTKSDFDETSILIGRTHQNVRSDSFLRALQTVYRILPYKSDT
jgi:hypothetical protein